MKHLFASLAIAAATVASQAAASPQHCLPIGGTALGQFFDDNAEVIGAMSGFWAAKRGSVLSQVETDTGYDLDMRHIFSTASGGVVTTRDKIKLTKVVGDADNFALDIAYTVDETFGHLKGYSGTFYSFGRLNLKTGEGLVRYTGEICK